MRHLKLFSLFLLCFVVGTLAAGWRPLNPPGATLPGVENPSVTLLPLTGDAYFFGGQISMFDTQTNLAFNDLFRYDILANSVTKLHPSGAIPAPRIFHGAWPVTSNTFMIAAGGNYDFFFSQLNFFNDFWKYDVRQNEWTQVHPSGASFPALLSFVVQKTDANHVYLFGGVNNQFQATGNLFLYNILQNSLTLLSPAGPRPADRYHTYSFESLRGFVIFGGVNTAGQYINDMWEYDTALNTWTQIQVIGQTPPDRTHGVVGKFDIRVVLSMGDRVAQGRACGGAIFPQSPANDTWIFNTVTRRWHEIQVESPTPALKYSASINFLRNIFAFGGYIFNNDTCVQTHNSNVWEFNLPIVFDD